VLINAELKTGKKCEERELSWGSPLGRRRSALDYSDIEEEEEEEEGEGEEGEGGGEEG
jgi:hypothetical protein